jgi:hypothetical protein
VSSNVNNFVINFFQDQNINNPPAKATRRLTATKIISATLNWNVRMDAGVWFDAISFNGVNLGKAKEGSADVTQYVILNGDNTVTLDYSRWLDPFGKAGVATASLSVISSGAVGQQNAPTTFSLTSLPWWVYGVIVVVVLLVLAWFLMRTSAGGRVVSAFYGTAKDVGRAVGGA